LLLCSQCWWIRAWGCHCCSAADPPHYIVGGPTAYSAHTCTFEM
jgi:hypothetical protein